MLKVVMYHYVRDMVNSRYPNIKGISVDNFQKQIKYLKERYSIVTMEQVLDAFKEGGGGLPSNAMLLTFDDGYIDHYTNVFPILQNEGVQGSFFIPGKTFVEHKLLDVNKVHFILASAHISNIKEYLFEQLDQYRHDTYPSNEKLYEEHARENRFDNADTIFVKRILQNAIPEKIRNMITSNMFEQFVGVSEEIFSHELYMQDYQIKHMKEAGMFIGLHGYDHYWLGKCSKQEVENDIDKALLTLRPYINNKNWVMNYPYGSYNEDVIEIIKSKGCQLGLTTQVRAVDLEMDSRYTLPRFDTNDFYPVNVCGDIAYEGKVI